MSNKELQIMNDLMMIAESYASDITNKQISRVYTPAGISRIVDRAERIFQKKIQKKNATKATQQEKEECVKCGLKTSVDDYGTCNQCHDETESN